MTRFKKVILSLFLALLLGGCNTNTDANLWLKSEGKVKVLSTTAQIGDLVKEIGGERVDQLVLIQGDLDPHSYEIVKGDLEKLERADIIFYNGLGLEHGASLASYLNNSSKTVAVGEKISLAHPDKILKKDSVIDPHIWMDISLWQKGIEPIVQILSEKDPEEAKYFQERANLLVKTMEEVDLEIYERLQKIPSECRYLMTSHDAFHYFTRRYLADPNEIDWQARFAAPEGLAPEGQLNPRDIQKMIAYLKKTKISVIFPESNVSRDAIRKIAMAGKEMGLEIKICSDPLYGDSMGHLNYLEMMKTNGETIAKHLCNQQ